MLADLAGWDKRRRWKHQHPGERLRYGKHVFPVTKATLVKGEMKLTLGRPTTLSEAELAKLAGKKVKLAFVPATTKGKDLPQFATTQFELKK